MQQTWCEKLSQSCLIIFVKMYAALGTNFCWIGLLVDEDIIIRSWSMSSQTDRDLESVNKSESFPSDCFTRHKSTHASSWRDRVDTCRCCRCERYDIINFRMARAVVILEFNFSRASLLVLVVPRNIDLYQNWQPENYPRKTVCTLKYTKQIPRLSSGIMIFTSYFGSGSAIRRLVSR